MADRTKEQALKAIRDLAPKTTVTLADGGNALKIVDLKGQTYQIQLQRSAPLSRSTNSFR